MIAFGVAQAGHGTTCNEQANAALYIDKAIVLKQLIRLCDGQRIGALLRSKCPYRWQHIPF